MEKQILEEIKIHYTLKNIHSDMYDGGFFLATKHLENEMKNDSGFARSVIEEYWEDYFANRPLYN